MKKLITLIVFISILISINIAAALDTKKLFRDTSPSVVLIMSFDKNNQPLAIGSGFFVGDGTKIATNLHVVSGADSILIKLPNKKIATVKALLSFDKANDLLLMKSSEKGQALTLSRDVPEIGEDIIVIGNPKGLEGTLSKGIISGIRNKKDSLYYQITAPISPGSSGGPVINEKGEVIGVSTFQFINGQNLNFAMPSAYIHKLLRTSSRNRDYQLLLEMDGFNEKLIPNAEKLNAWELFLSSNPSNNNFSNHAKNRIQGLKNITPFKDRIPTQFKPIEFDFKPEPHADMDKEAIEKSPNPKRKAENPPRGSQVDMITETIAGIGDIYYPKATTLEIAQANAEKTRSQYNHENRWTRVNKWVSSDSKTGLMWMTHDFRNLEKGSPGGWRGAKNWVGKINRSKYGGYVDWRLPSLNELTEIYDPNRGHFAFHGQQKVGYPPPFENKGGYWYWSMETEGSNNAWVFGFFSGVPALADKEVPYFFGSARLVR